MSTETIFIMSHWISVESTVGLFLVKLLLLTYTNIFLDHLFQRHLLIGLNATQQSINIEITMPIYLVTYYAAHLSGYSNILFQFQCPDIQIEF